MYPRSMYYHSFPKAPIELVSGIAAGAGIPSIVGCYVGIDNSVYLDIYVSDKFRIRSQHLTDIAEVCGVTLDELEISPGIDENHVSVSVVISCYDFSHLFRGTHFATPETVEYVYDIDHGVCSLPGCLDYVPGVEDSEEMMEATEAIINLQRN